VGVTQQLLELPDARLHLALLVLGRVVLGVLAQVAVGAGDLDLGGDPLATLGLERLELALEAVVGLLAQVGLGHGGSSCRSEEAGPDGEGSRTGRWVTTNARTRGPGVEVCGLDRTSHPPVARHRTSGLPSAPSSDRAGAGVASGMGVIDLAYRVYERRLADELAGGPLPQHVGVILDGNRRFARERGLEDPSDGHAAGAQRIDPFLDWCLEMGIPYVTLWLLSTENLGRDDAEVAALLTIIEDTVRRMGCSEGAASGACGSPRSGRSTCCPRRPAAASRRPRRRPPTTTGCASRSRSATAAGRRSPTRCAACSSRAPPRGDLEEVAATLRPEDIGDHLYTTGCPIRT
jgi:short-chain Z-isoprenyl diphosphate synthase